jgi:hypothetical protein
MEAGLKDPEQRDTWVRLLKTEAIQEFDRMTGLNTRSFTLGHRGPNTQREDLLAFCRSSAVDECGKADIGFWNQTVQPQEKIAKIMNVGAMLGLRNSDGTTPKPIWYIPDEACNELMQISGSFHIYFQVSGS